MKLVSVVVPMYNESAMADEFFHTVLPIIEQEQQRLSVRFEIIAVNDGSTDDTLSKLKIWNSADPRVGVVSLSRNFGQESAVFAGLEQARGDAVIVMDCDLQDPPEFIGQMTEKWQQGYDVVNARRVDRKSDTAFKSDTAGMYYRLLNRLSPKVRYPHNVNNFRLISRRVLDTILLMPEKQKFFRGLVPFAGFKTTEVLIERRKRLRGESKYNLNAMLRLAVEGITSTSTKPLYFPVKAGIAMCAIGFLAAAALTVIYLCGIIANYTLWGVLAGLCFFSGVSALNTGITAIYTAKAYEEIKGRPAYITEIILPPAQK